MGDNLIKQKYLLLAFTCFFLMSCVYLAQAEDQINIISPDSGSQFSDEIIPLYAQTSNDSMTLPFVKFSFDPGNIYPMSEFGSQTYIYNLNFSEYPFGDWSVLVISGGATDIINLTNIMPTEPEPTPLKTLYIDGITNAASYSGDSVFFTVYDNETRTPVSYPKWEIVHDNTIKKSGTGYYTGLANIIWYDNNGVALEHGIYLIRVLVNGYEVREFLVTLKEPETPEESLNKLSVFGFDSKVTIAVKSTYIIMDDDENYLADVNIKVVDPSDTVICTKNTNTNGRVTFDWSGFPVNDYVIEFEKYGYKRIVKDIKITTIPTKPTPTPIPTTPPAPTFTAYGTVFKIPYNFQGVSYTTAEQYTREWNADGTTKVKPTPTPAPTIQANNTGVPMETPTIKAGWVLVALLLTGAIGMTVYKNYPHIPNFISNLRSRKDQSNGFIPEPANTPDYDIGDSTLPIAEEIEEIKDAIEKEPPEEEIAEQETAAEEPPIKTTEPKRRGRKPQPKTKE